MVYIQNFNIGLKKKLSNSSEFKSRIASIKRNSTKVMRSPKKSLTNKSLTGSPSIVFRQNSNFSGISKKNSYIENLGTFSVQGENENYALDSSFKKSSNITAKIKIDIIDNDNSPRSSTSSNQISLYKDDCRPSVSRFNSRSIGRKSKFDRENNIKETNSVISDIIKVMGDSNEDEESNNSVSGVDSISEDDSLSDDLNFDQLVNRYSKNTSIIEVKTSSETTIEDFEIIDILSKGAFGRVYLAKKKATKEVLAVKKIDKKYLQTKNLYQFLKNESNILNNINNDYLVRCYYSFEDNKCVYFVMEYLNGGDLSFVLDKLNLNEKEVKVYAAEIALALEYLHSIGVVHRDIKPANIMIDKTGHIKLTDFGLSEVDVEDKKNTSGRVFGTAQYLAPELLQGEPHGKDVDYWALGVLIFQMLVGRCPFRGKSEDEMFTNVVERRIEWPEEWTFTSEAKDLIESFLQKDPSDRLGSDVVDEIKNHPWFSDIDWLTIRSSKALFKPKVESMKKGMYFKKMEDVKEENEEERIELPRNKSEFSKKRFDLLHKANLDYLTEIIKRTKGVKVEWRVTDMIEDMEA